MVDFIFVDVVFIDHLIEHVDFSSSAKEHGVTNFEGEFVFYLDIAHCEAVRELELCGFYHILWVLEHETNLELAGIEYYMIVFDIDFVWFTNNSTLANMMVFNVIKKDFIILLC